MRFCCSIVEHAWPGEAARVRWSLSLPQKPALVADFRAYTPVHQLARNHQTLHCNVGAVSPCGFAAQSSSMHGPERPRVSDRSLSLPQKPALVADFRAYTPVHQLARNHQTLHCNVGAVSPCGFAAQSSSMHGPERPRVSDGH